MTRLRTPPRGPRWRRGRRRLFGFSVGVAATGNPPNISGRLFKTELVEEVWTRLGDRPTGLPGGFGTRPDPVTWSQNALTWRHEVPGPLNRVTVVRAAWDGSVAAGQRLSTDEFYPDHLAAAQIADEWRFADDLVEQLGGFGDVYVTVLLSGGRFPRRKESGYILMQRGPILPGVANEHVESLGRELMRAVGNIAAEP
jgi:hypothetical protein